MAAALVLAAFGLNWLWEMVQMPAYVQMAGRSWTEATLPCALASLGDVPWTLSQAPIPHSTEHAGGHAGEHAGQHEVDLVRAQRGRAGHRSQVAVHPQERRSPGEEQARSGAGDILRLAHVPAPEFFTMKESFIRCNRRSRTQVRARFPARPGAPWGVPLGRSLAAKCPVRAELAQGCEFLHQMQLASVVPQ